MKKYSFMLIFVITIISITLYNICSGNVFELMYELIQNINYNYVIILFSMSFLYFFFQALYMKLILKSLNCHISIIKGFFYSMVEFYFSGITPSSTGGQPMQLYFMTKDKIPIGKSYITLILNTIYFKLIIFILGIFVLIFYSSYVFSYSIIYTIFFFIGLTFDISLIIICSLLLFNQSLIKKIFQLVIKLGNKIKILRKLISKINIDETLKKYNNQLNYMKEHKLIVFITFILTFMQRLVLLSVAYVVYRGLGMTNFSYLDLLAIQITVQITIDMFPIPGGTGLSENMLKDIFITIFGVGIAEVGMIFTRLFNFYIPLLATGIIIIICYIHNKMKENE